MAAVRQVRVVVALAALVGLGIRAAHRSQEGFLYLLSPMWSATRRIFRSSATSGS